MQGGAGNHSVPQAASFDKTRVLDVKPLRVLKPLFTASGENPPSFPIPPGGPAPPGTLPFYPFGVPREYQTSRSDAQREAPVAPAPLRSFRTPGQGKNVEASREDRAGDGRNYDNSDLRPSRPSRKMGKRSKESEFWVADGEDSGGPDYAVPINSIQREDGDRNVVDYVLVTFDGIRRRLSQLEDSNEGQTGGIKRADLKAGNILMSKGFRTNMRRRIGAIPGVEVGDIFFFRMEMCVVGLHAPSMAGIDYLNVKGDHQEESVALSIVSSGSYEDDAGDKDVLIYSGQGGVSAKKDKEASDQKLERGNLALERSLRRANEVRVIRGMKDIMSPNSKVYVYDGLYRVQESWMDKGKSGANIFKYKLMRIPGQPDAFAVWKSIERCKEVMSTRPGLILSDLTSGSEHVPVSLVNEVDNERGPAYFNYFYDLRYIKPYNLSNTSHGCNCSDACKPGDLNCSCIQKNGGDFPFTGTGVLVSRKPLVHECGPSCRCSPNCKNRVSQSGLKLHLEVFKTKDRGWGLRSWDPIRTGSFICHYAGDVIDGSRLKHKLEQGEGDEHVFDTSRVYELFKWNYESGLLGEHSNDSSEEYSIPHPLIITAKNFGNVARFMNHSCNPNVFWQPVFYQQNKECYIRIAFYAKRHIPPMTELTYDYGILPDDRDIYITRYRKKKCLCGTSKCRGYFGL